eukprot:5088040-Lingulodinium_polyedra.AAC.1
MSQAERAFARRDPRRRARTEQPRSRGKGKGKGYLPPTDPLSLWRRDVEEETTEEAGDIDPTAK